jgi:hypothetical protein
MKRGRENDNGKVNNGNENFSLLLELLRHKPLVQLLCSYLQNNSLTHWEYAKTQKNCLQTLRLVNKNVRDAVTPFITLLIRYSPYSPDEEDVLKDNEYILEDVFRVFSGINEIHYCIFRGDHLDGDEDFIEEIYEEMRKMRSIPAASNITTLSAPIMIGEGILGDSIDAKTFCSTFPRYVMFLCNVKIHVLFQL